MSAIPLIRLEIQGMKHAICVAMHKHLLEMDEQIQAAVDAACKPEKITQIIQETAEREIEGAISEEIRKFYAYGNGREAIKEAVRKSLDDQHNRDY